MLFKIPVLIALIFLHNHIKNALACALAWGGFLLVFGLIQEGIDIWVIIYSAISFLLAIGFFALLDYFQDDLVYWLCSLVFGTVVLILLA